MLIKNSTIVDGSGKPAYQGSVGIRGERIVAVGDIEGEAPREIDGSGLVTCPGFIDMHSHADLTILKCPLAQNLVMQGITTFVGGNCGVVLAPVRDLLHVQFAFSLARWQKIVPDAYCPPPVLSLHKYRDALGEEVGVAIDWQTFGDFLSKVEDRGLSVNYVPLAGHNAIRLAVMGADFKRTAQLTEIDQMARHAEEAMEAGAFGLSSGLDYVPGEYSTREEVVELAKCAQKYGGLYFTHHRQTNFVYPSDDPDVLPGMEIYHGPPEEMAVGRYRGLMEAIDISRKAAIPLHISHISNVYTLYQPHPDYLDEAGARATLHIIDEASEGGADITFDVLANATGPSNSPNLIGLFPKWLIQLGSREALVTKLRMEDFRDELRAFMSSGEFVFQEINPRVDAYWMEKLGILRCRNRTYEGKTIGEISRAKKADPVDTIFEILIEDPDTTYRETRDERTTVANIPVFLGHSAAMIGTDHEAMDTEFRIDYPTAGYMLPHPNAYGLFPHFVGTYARDEPVLSLEEAIYKAAHLPAQRLGLTDRGVIAPGAYADIVVFDFQTIGMKGDLLEPHQAPEGIEYVLVNGEVTYEGKAHTGVQAGRVLRRS